MEVGACGPTLLGWGLDPLDTEAQQTQQAGTNTVNPPTTNRPAVYQRLQVNHGACARIRPAS